MMDTSMDIGKIILADLILSGDNALIIGMAAAGLAPELRAKAIMFGMVIAALLRIVFAVIATHLLAVPGLLFLGGLLLCYVCWRLFCEIREGIDAEAHKALAVAGNPGNGYIGPPRRTLASALWTITVADVSMSLDNVLAVAAIADGDTNLLIFGLALAIVLMAFAATLIMKVLTKYPWISWLGLVVLIWVAGEMLMKGAMSVQYGVLPMLGLTEGIHFGH